MGANSAVKAFKVMENLERILAIELYTASQALDFRHPVKTSPILEKMVGDFRRIVKFIENDIVMYNDINKTVKFLHEYSIELPSEDEEGDIRG